MMNKYYFLHIPKTAGTSLFTLFRSILGEEQVYQVRDVNIGKQRADAIQSFALVGGHLTYDQMQLYFERDRYRFTFLRDPVERFLSMYYYYRSVEEVTRDLTVRMAKTLDLVAYLDWLSDSDEYQHLRNAQTWYLNGGLKTKMSLAERLDLAKENLVSLDFVGITEHMADSLDFLCLDCRWPSVERIPRDNVTTRRPKMEDINGDIVQRIREISNLDMELYAYGLNLYEKQKRQLLRECLERQIWEVQAEAGNLSQSQPPVQRSERRSATTLENSREDDDFGTREIEILEVNVSGRESSCQIISSGEEALIRIIFKSHINEDNLTAGISIKDDFGQIIFGTNSHHMADCLSVHKGQVVSLVFRAIMDLGEGFYHLTVALHTGGSHLETCYHWKERACDFIVSGFNRTFFVGISGLYPAISYERVELSETLPMEMASGVSLKVTKVPVEIPCSTRFNALVSVTNDSDYDLASYPPYPVHLSYHWQSVTSDETVVFDGDRSLLLQPLTAYSTGTYGLSVLSPQSPGEYALRITLVQEMVLWFDQVAGHKFAECIVRVIG